MIHVDRYRVAYPSVLSPNRDSLGIREFLKAREFFHAGQSGQFRFEFKAYRHPEVRAQLTELFHGKCSYCETAVTATGPPDIELFRPKASVAERSEHPGYWWLASNWNNMLLSCADCNRVRQQEGVRTGKGNRFPLEEESERAFLEGEEVRERPLLLDPCFDFPEEHLVFTETGIVVSDTDRGQTTITVLGLNRKHLVEARLRTVQSVLTAIQTVERLIVLAGSGPVDENLSGLVKKHLAELERLTDESQEFAGLKRQLVGPFLSRLSQYGSAEALPSAAVPTPQISKARRKRAKESFRAFEHAQSSYSLADEKGRETYRMQRRLIERVLISDVKAIRKLDLDLTTPGSGRTPWMMLLGENGTGKSTFLEVIALTLLGARSFVRLATTRGVRPADFVSYGCRRGTVSVKLSGFVGPHQLIFHRDRVELISPTGQRTKISFAKSKPQIDGADLETPTVLLGYGATRLLPREETGATSSEFSRVDNLFDPFVPLFNAQSWLLDLHRLHRTQFDSVALVLKDLLGLDPSAELLCQRGEILVAAHGAKVPLRQLSDGYQSVVAMTIDILEVALRLWPNLADAEGIVLLDEIGAHLHPTWKMRIVGSLRRALPAMQFIASTHDPLCLRGLVAGEEVAVMRRDEDERVVTLTGLPSPGDFRIDQLLTSDFFGLNSTVDSEVEALFDEYYALLALTGRTDEQSRRMDELKELLKDRRHFGTTLRESLMYEAIDRLIAQKKREPEMPSSELKREAVEEVSRIWQEGIAARPGNTA